MQPHPSSSQVADNSVNIVCKPGNGLVVALQDVQAQARAGQVEVRAVDPVQTIGSSEHENLAATATEVRGMLARVIASLY